MTPQEKADLVELRSHSPKPYLRERASALLQVAEGASGLWVAQNGLLQERDPDSIYSWLDRYEEEGITGLPIREGRGRKPAYESEASCAEEAKEQIQRVLVQSPQRYGLAGNRWNLDFIRRAVGWLTDCTKAGAWQILKRLGFSRQQALSFIRSPDPFFQLKVRAISQAFSRALWHPEKVVVLFQDEMSYERQPDTATTWGLTGETQPRVQRATTGNQLTRIGAAMDAITGQLFYLQTSKFGVDKMQTLYQLIRHSYDQPSIFVVQDNWHNVHNHPAVLQTAQDLDITPLFLPTYASWLNPIEKLWRWLRQDVLYNHALAHDLAALRGSVINFLDQFAFGSDDLLHYCGLLPK